MQRSRGGHDDPDAGHDQYDEHSGARCAPGSQQLAGSAQNLFVCTPRDNNLVIL
jgi:hypothetical protein